MSAQSITLLAPAKLNLFLHITGRRTDGYHELQTLFQLLDYGDTVTVSAAPAGVFSLQLLAADAKASMPMDSNLVSRAVRLLRDRAGQAELGASIKLHKRIPAGAGLGGGSSDAAATLLALNQLWQLHWSRPQLAELGLQLGADVPVFIGGKSAWGEGVGERLQEVQLEPAWYLVITPNCQVSTAAIFCHENLTRNTPAIKMADFLAGRSHNDCESVTRALYPDVDQALNWLAQFAYAKMTGTGSSVFASFPDEATAQRLLLQLPANLHGFVAQGSNSLEQDFHAN
jgi:4-diphosphocytidyl-2-C-methyl-D-erythritol kinase